MTVSSSTKVSDESLVLRPVFAETDQISGESTVADIRILTSGGLSIPAHSSVLASISTVLEKLLDGPSKRRPSSEKMIPILGVPCDAVLAFLRFLYSSRCTNEEMDNYGIHLLTLSHVYSVHKLKQKSRRELCERLTVDNVVDVLQLSRLCDAPDLYLKCLKMVSNDFKTIETTEAWKFLQDHDPWLELEILKFLQDTESRQKRRNKIKEDQSLYVQLSEAMECLEHICTEGCTNVGPHDMEPIKSRAPCGKYDTCQGLQGLIRHFATCKKRVNGGCIRRKRMWQLLRLHSSICDDQSEQCRVPLCRQFKLKLRNQQEKKGNDAMWRLLVRKVVSAKVMTSLSLATNKRKRQEDPKAYGCWNQELSMPLLNKSHSFTYSIPFHSLRFNVNGWANFLEGALFRNPEYWLGRMLLYGDRENIYIILLFWCSLISCLL